MNRSRRYRSSSLISAMTKSTRWSNRCAAAGSPPGQGQALRGGFRRLSRWWCRARRRQLGDGRPAPRAGGPRHRTRRRGDRYRLSLSPPRPRSCATSGPTWCFVDIDPATYIDPDAVEAAITPRTRAVIVRALTPACAADMAGLLAIADGTAARSSKTQRTRCLRHASGRSSARSPAMPPSSASTPTRPSPPARAAWWSRATRRSPRAAGHAPARHDRDTFDRFTAKTASWRYDVVAPGYKYNLTDIAAALGIHQLKKARCLPEPAGGYRRAL